MRTQFSKLALAAAFGLALAITFGCSSDKDDDNSGGSPSSGENNTNGSGQGVLFNEKSQVYIYPDGSLFNGSGAIKVSAYDRSTDKQILIDAGNVTNGIVNLKLPTTIPHELLEDLEDQFDPNEQHSCTSPENIKSAGVNLVLTNSSGDDIGSLFIGYKDEQRSEGISYEYYSKTGKITCVSETFGGYYKSNIDAKTGWNKIYSTQNRVTWESEESTNNILTKEKEMKCFFWEY